MPRTIHKTEQPVILEGYQAVLKPSKFGYSLSALIDGSMIDSLEEDRTESLEWAQSKLKNPKRSTSSLSLGKKLQRVSTKSSLLGRMTTNLSL